jgi:HAD superfamily PSPase-like hydrolase
MKLIFFDMDGTLVCEPSSWVTLHRHFGADMEKAKRYREEFLQKKYSYEEWMRKDISLWMDRNPTLEEVRNVLSSYTLCENIMETCESLRTSCMLFIVSSGIDMLAEIVSERLSMDGYYANGFEAKEGFLTGEGIGRVDPLRKFEIVERVSGMHGMGKRDAVAVGEGLFDLSLFSGCGTSVAYRPGEEKVAHASDFVIQDFLELPDIISSLK